MISLAKSEAVLAFMHLYLRNSAWMQHRETMHATEMLINREAVACLLRARQVVSFKNVA